MRPGEPGSRQRVDSNSRPLPSWLPTRLLLGQARAGRAGTSPWGVSGLGGRGTATVPEGFRARKPRHAIVLVELRDSVARAWSLSLGGGEGGSGLSSRGVASLCGTPVHDHRGCGVSCRVQVRQKRSHVLGAAGRRLQPESLVGNPEAT